MKAPAKRLALGVILGALISAALMAAEEPFDRPAFDRLVTDILAATKTSAQRAERFYKLAVDTQGNRPLQLALLRKAYEYGSASPPGPGFDAVDQALVLLETADPAQTPPWAAKRLDLYRRGFRQMVAKTMAKKALAAKLVTLLLDEAARREKQGKWQDAANLYREAKFPAHTMNLFVKDEISRGFSRGTHFAAAQRKADRYAEDLQKDPQDLNARLGLVQTLVVELDDPAAAVEHLSPAMDETWRTYVRLAATPVSQLQGAAARELGDWYHKVLLPKATSFSQDELLARAKACYEQFLKSAPKDDRQAAMVKLTLDQVSKELWKRQADLRWINLLDHVDVAAGPTRGTCRLTPDGPRVFTPAQVSSVVPIRAMPQGNYELEVAFIRHSWGKPDSVRITCPVGTAGSVNVIIDGYGKGLAGFENIKGAGGSTLRENGTAVPCQVSNDREYSVQVSVVVEKDTVQILVKLRNSKIMEWKGPLASVLATEDDVPFGLGAGWNTSITYTAAKLRMLDGEVKLPSTTTQPSDAIPARRDPPPAPRRGL